MLNQKCARCGVPLESVVHTTSMFNKDVICVDCKDREKRHPLYEKAVKVEREEVLKGNYNYEGIGCPPELYEPETCEEKRVTFLTDFEAAALDKIADKTKMSCWFLITTKGEYDFIYDIEEKTELSLEEGIETLTEGITSNDACDYGLTKIEATSLNALFEKIPGCDFRFTKYNGQNFTPKKRNILCSRIRREFEEFKRSVVAESSSFVFKRAYEISWKEEIVGAITYDDFTEEEIEGLLIAGNEAPILDWLYSEWLDCDADGFCELCDMIKCLAREEYESHERKDWFCEIKQKTCRTKICRGCD